jgi:4-oxalmesaconate hydratase
MVESMIRKQGIDPETGNDFDDTKRYLDQVSTLSEEARYKIFEGNARRVYPLLDKLLTQRGHLPKTF